MSVCINVWSDTDEIACVDPDVCMETCESPAGCSNIAYPLLVLNLLPAGAQTRSFVTLSSASRRSIMTLWF